MQIQGITVVVTGGGRGIGRELAKSFAARGGNVALFDLNQADLDETAKQCAALGVTARGYLCNVTKEDEVTAAMDAVVRDFGRLDVLVNNAGIVKDGLLLKVKDGQVVGKMTLAQWQPVIDINLTGVFLCGREAAERMVKGGKGGVIINISSVSRHGNPGQTNYTATDILSAMKPEMIEKLTATVPLRRLGTTGEIAHAAIFIVENDFFTGRCVDVDGGMRI